MLINNEDMKSKLLQKATDVTTTLKNRISNKEKKDSSDNSYYCDWCGFIFHQHVRTSNSDSKHAKVTDQVVCPNCKTFIKSYS